MQEETYLEDADFDDIKRYDTLIEIRNFSPDSIYYENYNHNGKLSQNSLSYDTNRAQNHQYYYRKKRNEPILIDFDELKSRVKRQSGGLTPSFRALGNKTKGT